MMPGADADARALDLAPVASSPNVEDETLYHGQYREWLRLMNQGYRADHAA
jgi:benzoate/toluate 1,2-dioxygenase alpha subunit